MNIFVLSENPVAAAIAQCDAHVVKMCCESAQMLSTAHRVIDGYKHVSIRKGRKYTTYVHPDQIMNANLYLSCHVNHPSTRWTRETLENYRWHYNHFIALCEEYTHRFGKIHKSYSRLNVLLRQPPKIDRCWQTQFALAMKTQPQCMDPNDPIRSYREFYHTKFERMKMTWTKREKPSWWKL